MALCVLQTVQVVDFRDRLTSEKAKLELMVKYNLTDSEFALFTGNR